MASSPPEVRIAAAICTYSRYELLATAIQSLAAQTLPQDRYEILIIDNSPDPALSEEMAQDFRQIPNLRWIYEKTPGLSNARNVAINEAKAPLIAFMDDDAIASSNWLESLVSVFADFGPEVQVVGGRVDPIWGVPQPKWLPDSLLGNVSVVNWGGSDRIAGKGEWVAGTNIAFRVSSLKDIGGFSVHLGRSRAGHALLSNDESDVVERLGARGGRLVYSPRATVSHLVPAERLSQVWFRRRIVWQAVSDYLSDASGLFERAPSYWRQVTDYYTRLPPKYRTPKGLYVDHDDPELFRQQISALYNFTVVMLTGFNGIEGP
ncbi:MAG: glycosyltransferase family 2 protein [Alphaproteobacteria bacterium]|nr:glycosyltransferase family 2 protein [Alphaproteobacteria bacterium]MBV9694761.1 glycosyltransferase family 2 protein [Alphaproteobacteria bacterium]